MSKKSRANKSSVASIPAPVVVNPKAAEIEKLLGELKVEVDGLKKKKIRRALRARGYFISKPDTHEAAMTAKADAKPAVVNAI